MMSSPTDDGDEPLNTDDPETTTKKSERKRQREKQRRSDLASAFDELGALLARLEPDELDSSTNSRKRKRGKSGTDSTEPDQCDSSGMTRLDLIGRTIETLRRLHRENTDLKQNIEEMRQKGSDGDKEVLVMVPTLTATDERGQQQHRLVPRAAYASYYGHYQQPLTPMHHGPPPAALPQDHVGPQVYYAQQPGYQPFPPSWASHAAPSHAHGPHPSAPPPAGPPPMYGDPRGQPQPPPHYGSFASPSRPAPPGHANGSSREDY